MFGISGIMVGQPLFQISGIANISLVWKFFRLYKINIKHIRIYIIFSHTSSRLRVALLCLNGSSYVWRSHPNPRLGEGWCGRRESNPRLQLGKLTCYHYTTPAFLWLDSRYDKKSSIKHSWPFPVAFYYFQSYIYRCLLNKQ